MGYKYWKRGVLEENPEINFGKWKGWGRYDRRVSEQNEKDLYWLAYKSGAASHSIKEACKRELRNIDELERKRSLEEVKRIIMKAAEHPLFRKVLAPIPEWGLE